MEPAINKFQLHTKTLKSVFQCNRPDPNFYQQPCRSKAKRGNEFNEFHNGFHHPDGDNGISSGDKKVGLDRASLFLTT